MIPYTNANTNVINQLKKAKNCPSSIPGPVKLDLVAKLLLVQVAVVLERLVRYAAGSVHRGEKHLVVLELRP